MYKTIFFINLLIVAVILLLTADVFIFKIYKASGLVGLFIYWGLALYQVITFFILLTEFKKIKHFLKIQLVIYGVATLFTLIGFITGGFFESIFISGLLAVYHLAITAQCTFIKSKEV